MLKDGIDWTVFARKAVDHRLASLAGHALLRIASDIMPEDICDAFRMIVDQTRRENQALIEELADVVRALSEHGVEAVPFDDPVVAFTAYGDPASGVFESGLNFLIHDGDIASSIAALADLGCERNKAPVEGQIETVRPSHKAALEYRSSAGTRIALHTKLAPTAMGLDIDYDGLWNRAQLTNVSGRSMLRLAPEDDLIFLAIRGDQERWRNIRRACDVAAVIGLHPNLDWNALVERARVQGSLHSVLLATALARTNFNAAVPETISSALSSDTEIGPRIGRVLAQWRADPPTESRLSQRLSEHRGEAAQEDTALVATTDSAKTKPGTGRYERARADAERALAADPHDLKAYRNLGQALFGLQRYKEAIACYDKALAIEPENAAVWRKRRAALNALGIQKELYDFQLAPQDADGWAMRAGALLLSKSFAEAVEASDRALAFAPEHVAATRIGIHARLHSCDWRRRGDDRQRITAGLQSGAPVIRALDHRALCDSEEELRLSARLAAREIAIPKEPLWGGERYGHDKIRIAYMSTDFRLHAVSSLIVGCFEHHDRTRFETTAVSLHPGDGSELRRRIEIAFDRFINAHAMGDAAVARLLRDLEIDILIDLNGYTGEIRTGILARRPAPVQVNYLGFPGTMDAPFMDYILADEIVIPKENQIHYREKVVNLPHSYLPHDRKRPIPENTPNRTQAQLPERSFVFACLNSAYKIGPESFDVWMRLLRAVEGSVLWLQSTHVAAMVNLRREAKTRGVAPERLIFAPPVPRAEDHLARLGLADLFLDTLSYNAHTTASEALWAGLPVVTCPGKSFAARVAASLLHAVGLPELVTASLAQYEALALALARDPERLTAIKRKLTRNRDTEPLFDTARFTRDLESAYTTMRARQNAGLPPESFAVATAS